MAGILLVHGGWHGPWCWDAFAGRLADAGHDVRTVQLRGHDQRAGRIWYRISDYLEDVRAAAARFDDPPILVGHSMGGLLVQKHLERDSGRGAVLMASIPPRGPIGLAGRLGARHPLVMLKVNVLLRLGPLLGTPALVRELMFTPATPQTVVDACHARVQDESYLAFLDMLAFAFRRPRRVDAPVLVLGAERDAVITTDEVRRTARVFGSQAEIFPEMGHNMMLEAGWDRVADRVDGWIRESQL
jgi:pimeloyl-ACP methyl ester carboxylesterase